MRRRRRGGVRVWWCEVEDDRLVAPVPGQQGAERDREPGGTLARGGRAQERDPVAGRQRSADPLDQALRLRPVGERPRGKRSCETRVTAGRAGAAGMPGAPTASAPGVKSGSSAGGPGGWSSSSGTGTGQVAGV
ncbi:hypothetical protein KV557_33125 [Kitasatospora aureofaciens]|uniref:hypothetical protein n=1 Tax=Kitasatospora aureofaciens TaxID=1894 RepID=UPI001C462D77|nr:hypothetical protein [Kitasatospora aureofaciens]MBV6701892.1 hypothetical protein [Kitasatospora aureofaciens]